MISCKPTGHWPVNATDPAGGAQEPVTSWWVGWGLAGRGFAQLSSPPQVSGVLQAGWPTSVLMAVAGVQERKGKRNTRFQAAAHISGTAGPLIKERHVAKPRVSTGRQFQKGWSGEVSVINAINSPQLYYHLNFLINLKSFQIKS